MPVAKTRVEIETLLQKAKAERVGVMTEPGKAHVMFTIGAWSVQFTMPLPGAGEKRFRYTASGRLRMPGERADAAAKHDWEQECKERWRALLLTIKAKLVSVENGVETFEEAFMAHIVTPTGETVAQRILPALRSGQPMLILQEGSAS